MTRYNKKFISIFIFGLIITSTTGCKKAEDGFSEKDIIRPVKVVEALYVRSDMVKSFSGLTRSSFTSKLSFRVSGTLISLPVDVGQNVKKNELVAELDPTDYEIRVEEVKASLARARAQARNAKASYARVQALYERGNASLNELDATRAAASSSRAAVRSVEKQLELVKRQLEYTNLFSPKDCSIASLFAEENENIGAGQPLMLLNCGDDIEVKISVPASYIDRIHINDTVSLRIDSIKAKVFKGRVKEVGISPTGIMTTYPVIISVLSEDNKIRPGMSSEVFIHLNNLSHFSAIIVPAVSVVEDSKGRFVYVVEPGKDNIGIIKRKNIKTEGITSMGIPVLKGLESGDLVVTAGLSQIHEGLKVKINKD